MNEGSIDAAKQAAGESAADEVEDGMVVGLGTGSTTAYAVRAIGQAVDAGLDVTCVPTSFQARELARDCGIPLAGLDEVSVDLAIDGADEVVDGNLVKGGGASHAREKVVDASADRFIVIADSTKLAETLSYPVPLEVLPMARTTVADAVRDLGGDPSLRPAERKSGPVVTDNGNLVVDCDFGTVDAPADLARALADTPGVVEHGLFVEMADEVHVGREDGVTVHDL